PSMQYRRLVCLCPVGSGYFIGYVTSDASGNISQSLNVGQGIPHGTYPLNATDGGISVGAGNTVTITPAITSRTPDHGNPGNSVTVYGAGFAANSTVTLTLGGTPLTASVTRGSGNGQVSNLQLKVQNSYAEEPN